MDEKAGFQASAFADFGAAARAALAYLHERIGLELWIVVRRDGDHVVVDDVIHAGLDVAPGHLLALARALHAAGLTRVEPVAADVPQPTEIAGPGGAPLAAYVSVAIPAEAPGPPSGFVYGLASVAPGPGLHEQVKLVELIAAMLGRLLATARRAQEADERAEQAEEEARTDALTGVASRRSWTRIMEREEARSRRYGHPASIVSIDLDDLKQVNDTIGHAAGDELLCSAAHAITSATRQNDVVARLGGDEFGVLAFESDEAAVAALSDRIATALERRGIQASVGVSTRSRDGTLDDTWREADEAMYAEKRARAQAA